MTFDPFAIKTRPVYEHLQGWNACPKPYNKHETNPYTKARICLMNGIESEAQRFGHEFSCRCSDNDVRRELAVIRAIEQQQQRLLTFLKPQDETLAEQAVVCEQLAVDLTATAAACEPDRAVKAALDFTLIEDLDHLYRFANLSELDTGVRAERLTGRYTEIMPGRPTLSAHRYPGDNVRRPTDYRSAKLITKLHILTLTATERQTMRFYTNAACFYSGGLGRKLFSEIASAEEAHVTHYESLADPGRTYLEEFLLREYNECYLYYSCYVSESEPYIKRIWEECLTQEAAHLKKAAELLYTYEGKDPYAVLGTRDTPELTTLHSNIEYVRCVLHDTVQLTTVREDYYNVNALPEDSMFYATQRVLNGDENTVPSHTVVVNEIAKRGSDYRYTCAPSPVEALRDRKTDNTAVGRVPLDIPTPGFAFDDPIKIK